MVQWQGEIRRASPDDAKAVGALLGEAFMADPVSGWIFPDEQHRARVHAAFFGEFVQLALDGGEVWLAGDGAGATLWLPVDGTDHGDDGSDLYRSLEAGVGAEAMKRFAVLDELMTANHPAEPHWYLPFIGVHPDHHGQGVGSALLQHQLTRLDAEGHAGYLEASCPRNAALYERLGFRRTPVTLELPGGPSLYPMWRDPA
ncbi:GNAT family N-acetyltransferase [Micromonospora siamensis]|uniref:Acetyltransferase (GNAT) family protein n=1 Tax=Micromonospora siamensis TaxID=299152 RepID=A0A1C5HY82_9ACTN|nr:GNAT family N-acetyltransferase [Micromonospora siamensis]SCG50965.1 Acetyltransferase (GNAT) family protein [Micromonospora siamensis]